MWKYYEKYHEYNISILFSSAFVCIVFLSLPLISFTFVSSAFYGLWMWARQLVTWALESGNWKDNMRLCFLQSLEPHMIWWYIISYSFVHLPIQIDAFNFLFIKKWLLLLLDRYFIFGLEMDILDIVKI